MGDKIYALYKSEVTTYPMYNHINLALYMIGTGGAPTTDQIRWLGERYKILLGGSALDITPARAVNPNFRAYNYISHSLYNYPNSGHGTINGDEITRWEQWHALNPSYDREDLYFHYAYDIQYPAGVARTRGGTQLSMHEPPYPNGFIPGYPSGSGENRASSRLINWSFGSAYPPVGSTGETNITSYQRTSNIVTINTSVAHQLHDQDLVRIAGGTPVDGVYLIASTPTTTSLTFTKTGANIPLTIPSGAYTKFEGWNDYYWNVSSEAAKLYFIWLHTSSEHHMVKDHGGNYWNGYYMDSLYSPNMYSVVDYSKIRECIDGGGGADPQTWINNALRDYLKGITDGINTYLVANGRPADVSSGNGDAAYIVAGPVALPFYKDPNSPKLILLEDCFNPWRIQPFVGGDNDGELIFKTIWELMNTYGHEVIFEAKNYFNSYRSNLFHGRTGVWTRYSGDVWVTDIASGSRAIISQVYEGSIYVSYDQANPATSPETCTPLKCYTDTSTGLIYANFGVGATPTNGEIYGIQGFEWFRFYGLCAYYIWGKCANGYYHHQEFKYNTYYERNPGTPYTWFDAMGYNIGQPAVGGLMPSGGYGTTIYTSESTSISNLCYEYWRKGTTSTDRYERIYARKYDNAYVFMRICPTSTVPHRPGTDLLSFTLPFNFRLLRADCSLDPPTNVLNIARGEGAILITNYVS